MRRVYVREEACIGCRLCEIACIVEHSQSKDIIAAMRHETPRAVPLTRVQVDGPVSFSLQCRHCTEPLCAYSCLTQALRKGEDGIVRYDPDRCMACYTCMLACPYGAIQKASRGAWKGIAKCDLCDHREVPACVAACPNEALVFGEQWELDELAAAEEEAVPSPAGLAVGGEHA